MQRERLIKAIETYALLSGLKASTICQYAVQNRNFYDNIVSGGDYKISTAERIVQYIRENPATLRNQREGAA